jgi:hypothetical protein
MNLVQHLLHVNEVLREKRRNVLSTKSDVATVVQTIDLLYETDDSRWQHVALGSEFVEVGTPLALCDLAIADHVFVTPAMLRPGEQAEIGQAQTISI